MEGAEWTRTDGGAARRRWIRFRKGGYETFVSGWASSIFVFVLLTFVPEYCYSMFVNEYALVRAGVVYFRLTL